MLDYDSKSIEFPCGIEIFFFFSAFQDIARLTFIALRNEKINNRLLTFAGPRAWTTQEVESTFTRLLALIFFILNKICSFPETSK